MIDRDELVKQYDAFIYQSVCEYFSLEENKGMSESWAETYSEGWDISIWETEPVKPPHMA